MAVFGFRVQQIPFRPDDRLHRGHQLLTNRVQRWVRDLREKLLEVVVERLWTVRQHGQGRICPHRSDRLLAVRGHRPEDVFHVLQRIAERHLLLEQCGAGWRRGSFHLWDALDRDQVLLQPIPVRVLGGQLRLDLRVIDDPPLFDAHQEHLAGL